MTVFHLLKYLYERKHQVILATFTNQENFPEEESERINDFCVEVKTVPLKRWKIPLRLLFNLPGKKPFQVAYYQDKKMKANVEHLIQKHQPDVIYGHLIRVAEYIKDIGDYPTILAMQVAQTLNYRRLIMHERDFFTKTFYTWEYKRVARYEPQKVREFDRLLLISPHDKRAIFSNDRHGKIFFNPHGIDVDYFSEDLKLEREKNTLVMNGDFGVPTNIDAALYFYHDIFPLIKKEIPDVRLWLVGRNPASSVAKLATDRSVTVTGKVQDIRPYLQGATVGIAPLRVAAGLQNKILVSFASKLPLISTTVANEGICAPEGEVIMIADDATDFAQKTVGLLRSQEERSRIGKNALHFVQTAWTWDFHFSKLEAMMEQLIADRHSDVNNYYPFDGSWD